MTFLADRQQTWWHFRQTAGPLDFESASLREPDSPLGMTRLDECFDFKDREGDASQLNRLGVAYFLIGLLPISTTRILRLFVGAQLSGSCLSFHPSSGGAEKHAFTPAQVLAES